MDEVIEARRGPGRPPKVRPEVNEYGNVVPKGDVLVEVKLLKKYAPLSILNRETGEYEENSSEIKQTHPAGSVIFVTKTEALRVINGGIAQLTENSFG